MNTRTVVYSFLIVMLAHPALFSREASAFSDMICLKTVASGSTTLGCDQTWGNAEEAVNTHGTQRCFGTNPNGQPLVPAEAVFVLEDYPNNLFPCWIEWVNPGTYTLEGFGNYLYLWWNYESNPPVLEWFYYLTEPDYDITVGVLP